MSHGRMVNVAVTGGDGIGPEVTRAGMRIMEAGCGGGLLHRAALH
ncbi:MAG: hypothetical protein AVDCRST_MAG55-28 [uncultured Rubrobacteraceae bacterium]|uniref:3-isopropylmalate dehydrogenase n=1 Tax=uncultured Rubrobacteraceae bacterium TaxID=349277 RepID=A0A6J4NQT9_9ACTN|nr:MAG: hypothetical protein AVDCRST_MAG55-28 [uncultured Rubrobacteraceae bacterium]